MTSKNILAALASRYNLAPEDLEALLQEAMAETGQRDSEPKHISQLFAQHESAAKVAQTLSDQHLSKPQLVSSSSSTINEPPPGHKTLNDPAPPEHVPDSVTLDDDAWGNTSLFGVQNQGLIKTQEGKLYEDMGLLGVGGLGEVRRVRDVALGRSVAMKLLRPSFLDDPETVTRFIEEAQVTSQLQHPGLAPVHELGRTKDGRLYFVMREIKGRNLREAIEEVHTASSRRAWRPTTSGWTFRRLIDVFAKICEAVAFTHEHGVIHRDIKPDNVMLGQHGEVLVVDWGLVKVLDSPRQISADLPAHERIETVRSRGNVHDTREGAISGTPAYMSPEQARAEQDRIDERSDIYSLGATLYEILSGKPPYDGETAHEIIQRVLTGPPVPLELAQSLGARPSQAGQTDTSITNVWTADKLPKDLVAICERAMARDTQDRYQSVNELLAALEAWLDGDHNRKRAGELVELSRKAAREERQAREEALELEARASTLQSTIEAWQPEAIKAEVWALEDRAQQAKLQASLKSLEAEQLLNGALIHDPNDEQAHGLLAKRYRSEHERAERAGDSEAALRAEAMLGAHVQALPPSNQTRSELLSYLRGTGSVTLLTEPAGAQVWVERYIEQNRRLVTTDPIMLGVTPLRETSLGMGSYKLTIKHPERAPVAFPVQLDRSEHRTNTPLDSDEPHTLALPRLGSMEEDDIFIPAGWFWAGHHGEQEASENALRRQLIWLDSFVIKRDHITHRQFIEFLDELLLHGKESRALNHAPRRRTADSEDPRGDLLYELSDEGFVMGDDRLDLDQPVTQITWDAANAYARWYSIKTNKIWRLPFELEWEKAARGVDARIYPWGDHFDASWCCVEQSHQHEARVHPIGAFPIDVSPYGVRDMGGNVLDFCADMFRAEGPELQDQRFNPSQPKATIGAARVARGSSWNRSAQLARVYERFIARGELKTDFIGFRLVRSVR